MMAVFVNSYIVLYAFLKTTATRMCNRRPTERSGVADPIFARRDQPHITRAEACQGQICVAMVVCWVRDGVKVTLSGHFDRLSDRTQTQQSERDSETGKKFCVRNWV